MKPNLIARTTAAAALVGWIASTAAAVLFSQAPLPGINGIQSDGSTGPLSQAFTVLPGEMLGAIEWHGYHLPGSFGPGSDAFTVLVNGLDVAAGALGLSSTIVSSDGGFDLIKYTLDIVDIPVASGMFELANGPDTQWAWQFSASNAGLTAFALIGANGNNKVPEPATAALVLLALACARARRGVKLPERTACPATPAC